LATLALASSVVAQVSGNFYLDRSNAELTLRGTTLMLGPESEAMGKRSAKSVGASPANGFRLVLSGLVPSIFRFLPRTFLLWLTKTSEEQAKRDRTDLSP
jgi:hypothetical protein